MVSSGEQEQAARRAGPTVARAGRCPNATGACSQPVVVKHEQVAPDSLDADVQPVDAFEGGREREQREDASSRAGQPATTEPSVSAAQTARPSAKT